MKCCFSLFILPNQKIFPYRFDLIVRDLIDYLMIGQNASICLAAAYKDHLEYQREGL